VNCSGNSRWVKKLEVLGWGYGRAGFIHEHDTVKQLWYITIQISNPPGRLRPAQQMHCSSEQPLSPRGNPACSRAGKLPSAAASGAGPPSTRPNARNRPARPLLTQQGRTRRQDTATDPAAPAPSGSRGCPSRRPHGGWRTRPSRCSPPGLDIIALETAVNQLLAPRLMRLDWTYQTFQQTCSFAMMYSFLTLSSHPDIVGICFILTVQDRCLTNFWPS